MIWTPKELLTQKAQFNFTSSGGGIFEVEQILTDQELIINSVSHVDLSEDSAQLRVCESCGFPGCSSGDWVIIRRFHEDVLFLPWFDRLTDSRDAGYFDPPDVLRKNRTCLRLTIDQYESLANQVKSARDFNELETIQSKEIACLFQWNAPFESLGKVGNPKKFEKRLFISTSVEDGKHMIKSLERMLERLDRGVELEVGDFSDDKHEPVSFFLEGSEFVEWQPLVIQSDGDVGLFIPEIKKILIFK